MTSLWLSSATSQRFHLFPLGSLMLLFNSAENVLKLQASFQTFYSQRELAGKHLMQSNNVWNTFWYFLSELDLDVVLFWMSTSTPQRRLLQETLWPGLQSRRAWPAREETAQPGVIAPHTHSLSFTTYNSLSVGVEARMTDSARKVEERRYLERGKLLGS